MKVRQISLRKKLALELFRRYKINQSKLHTLNYFFWECTLRCNLKCLHCGSDCTKDSLVKDMPAEDFFKVLDEVKGLVNPNSTIIVLTGGEPLMRRDIESIGRELYSRGFPWSIVTNAMLLNEKKLQSLLDSGLRSITISLDGLEQSHNWLRANENSFRNAITAIKLLPKTENLVYDVATCVNPANYNELSQIRDLLVSCGVKNWRIFTTMEKGRAKENVQLQLEPAEFKGLFEFIRETRKEKKIHLDYGCEGFLGAYENEARDGIFFCNAGINVASVLADGSISACPSLRDNYIQGNIYKDNFAEVWNHKFEKFRDRSWTKTGICSDCEFYKYCEGNSLHLRDEARGEILFCHVNRIEEGEKMLEKYQV